MSESRDPVAVLTHEHAFIKMVLGALASLADRIAAAQRVDPDTLRSVARVPPFGLGQDCAPPPPV